MWIGVHQVMFELDPKVTYKKFQDWICDTDPQESSIIDNILKHVPCKPEYYERFMKILESKFISDTALLLPKVKSTICVNKK